MKTTFLQALTKGDLGALTTLLADGVADDGSACTAARQYADDNDAEVLGCAPAGTTAPGFTVSVKTLGTVGSSVIDGTQNTHATADATAVFEPRCRIGDKKGHSIRFACDGGDLTVDPTAGGFMLDLSDFYSVHLTK